MLPHLHTLLALTIVALSLLLMLVRPRNLPEVWWVGAGALLLPLLHLLPWHVAGHAIAQGTDVYLFLLGMMLLSALAREHGVFRWVAARAVRGAHGSSTRLFALVYAIGILTTIFLSNDATAVVLTPAVLAAVRGARAQPRPYLFACATIANAASFVLPISNPANLVVFHTGMPPLGQWLASFGLASAFAVAATYAVLRLRFRHDLQVPLLQDADNLPLPPVGKLVLAGLALVVVVLLITSALHADLGLPTCLAAVSITAAVSLRERTSPLKLFRDLSWSTLLLVAGLFVLVAAVETLGALRYTVAVLHWAATLTPAAAAVLVSLVVGISNNLVNNLPLGLLMGPTVQAAHVSHLLRNAVLLGVDLGPNLSVTGSLATILWLLELRRDHVEITAWDFLLTGALAMPLAMLASTTGLLLTHFLLRS